MSLEIKDYDASGFLEIEELHNLKYEGDIEFHFYLTLTIGNKGTDSGDLFSILVMTPMANQDYSINKHEKHYLIKYGDNWETIYNSLSEIVKSCSADSWAESVRKLSKHFRWEYEGIR
ncbi:Imm8 family immunity protein [Bacillus salitolerans]|uniref:Imm8 family immunity protein n=1 Tax=Bacillus salitolerans TaxID=1437434 RepID=A0ABW4LZ56_9BACI